MEKDEAVRLLRWGAEGIAEWNRRTRERADRYFINPDLVDVDLRDTDLRNAVLAGANLERANLRRANLKNSSLSGAKLVGACLSGTDLTGANLYHADFTGASLWQAKLADAYLSNTNLSDAYLVGTNFDLSVFSTTLLVGLDLSEASGLESAIHDRPSALGFDTLILSRGKIPEPFLRGCGVPESMIAYLPSLINGMQPIQFYSCFISYSTKDDGFAKRLHARMVQEGMRVWYSPEDVAGGKKLHEQIDEAIRVHDKLLLVLSEHSMCSEWVMTEVRKARKAERLDGKRKLFPIRMVGYDVLRDWECFDADGGKDLAAEVREYFIPDFTGWKDHDAFEKAFGRLLRDMKNVEGPGTGPIP